jgi:hypothetical protein
MSESSAPHTSSDWRMLLRGIQAVPSMVSQIRPLFHTSTMRPRSKQLISLEKQEREAIKEINSHSIQTHSLIERQISRKKATQ